MTATLLKSVFAVLLFVIWAIFAWEGKTPVEPFITAVGAAIAGLGIYHARTSAVADGKPDEPSTPPAQ